MTDEFEGCGLRYVRVDSRLLAEAAEWSRPVQVRWVTDEDGCLVMTFREPEGVISLPPSSLPAYECNDTGER